MSPYQKIDKHIAEGSAGRILSSRAQYEHGTQGPLPVFYRYVVLDVIFDPQITVDGAEKLSYWEHTLGVTNMEYAAVLPRNTIIGQRVLDGSTSSADRPMFLFPFFPSHLALPCKPGEHVWVMFEAPGSKEMDIGYWFCKITEVNHVDDVNHTHAPRAFDASFIPKIKDVFDGTSEPKYEYRNGRADEVDGERYTVPDSEMIPGGDQEAYEKLIENSDASQVMKYEPVPRFRKRPGDVALEGSNNTLIVLGTDRVGAAADINTKNDPEVGGKKPSKFEKDLDGDAGSIDLVVGRGQTEETGGKKVTSKKISDGSDFQKEIGKAASEVSPKEGDVDFANDRSRILISQRTKVDRNFDIAAFNTSKFPDSTGMPGSGLKDPEAGSGAIVIKSDKIRLIARMDVEILVTNYETDTKGTVTSLKDTSKFASIVIKSSGDIIFRPAEKGYIKLGDDTADRAILCTDAPAVVADGKVDPSTPALTTTMGGAFGGTKIPTQGTWAKKILVTGAK